MGTATRHLIVPTPEESRLAAETLKSLSSKGFQSAHFQLHFRTSRGSSHSVPLPPSCVRPLIEILQQTSGGNAVSVVPVRRELTTQEAAEILNVSRPFLISLVEKGEIPARMVGSHRRIPLLPLLEYKRKTAAIREEALDQLAAEAQELKLY